MGEETNTYFDETDDGKNIVKILIRAEILKELPADPYFGGGYKVCAETRDGYTYFDVSKDAVIKEVENVQ